MKLISGEETQSNTFEVNKMLMVLMTVIMLLMITTLGSVGKEELISD